MGNIKRQRGTREAAVEREAPAGYDKPPAGSGISGRSKLPMTGHRREAGSAGGPNWIDMPPASGGGHLEARAGHDRPLADSGLSGRP